MTWLATPKPLPSSDGTPRKSGSGSPVQGISNLKVCTDYTGKATTRHPHRGCMYANLGKHHKMYTPSAPHDFYMPQQEAHYPVHFGTLCKLPKTQRRKKKKKKKKKAVHFGEFCPSAVNGAAGLLLNCITLCSQGATPAGVFRVRPGRPTQRQDWNKTGRSLVESTDQKSSILVPRLFG